MVSKYISKRDNTWDFRQFIEKPKFFEQAFCRTNPDVLVSDFYRSKGGGPVSAKVKLCCRVCLVQKECLVYALKNNEEGYWGGTTEKERRRIKSKNIDLIIDTY